MSYPPPPGFQQPPSSLPPRPPPSANSNKPHGPSSTSSSGGYGGNAPRPGYNATTAFQPRSVASHQPYRTHSPAVSTPPGTTPSGYSTPTTTTGYGGYQSQPQQSYQNGSSYYGSSSQYNDNSYGPSVPRIQNPFAPSGADQSGAYGGRGRNNLARNDSGLDPETEAQIAQWQSAYASKEELSAPGKGPIRRDGNIGTAGVIVGGGAAAGLTGVGGVSAYPPSSSNTTTSTPAPIVGQAEGAQKTVARSGGGQNWTDSTLLEWDPAHFRLFVGNLAGEVTDDSLLKAFSKYASIQKARVIRDKRTQKSKGYGFVSFSDGDDYFKAAREMQGKYIGSHPILLRRATTEIREVSNSKNRKNGGRGGGSGGGHGGGGAGGGKVKHDGVKKSGKTKGGLRILG